MELNVVDEDFALWQIIDILFAPCQNILNDQFVLPDIVQHDWKHTVVPLTSSLSLNYLEVFGIFFVRPGSYLCFHHDFLISF